MVKQHQSWKRRGSSIPSLDMFVIMVVDSSNLTKFPVEIRLLIQLLSACDRCIKLTLHATVVAGVERVDEAVAEVAWIAVVRAADQSLVALVARVAVAVKLGAGAGLGRYLGQWQATP